ncbi:MAG: CvpA family protein [Verrucomicrobia bacterium]|nr:CvpA family protein [Verrucomicrobiota bacterium]
MLIWTLAVLLVVIVCGLGYLQGALRLGVSIVGLFLSLMLAFPLSPLCARLVPLVGIKHPVWTVVWPPIWAFLILFLIFVGIAFFVQHRVNLYFKYRTDDLTRLRWERLNKRLGICLGCFMASVWLFVFGLVIHITGHFAVQVVSDDTSSMTFRYLSRAKQDLHATGLEKSVAVFDPMPATYYQVCDIIGLIYNNPILLNRLSQYPPFLSLGQRQEFQDIATDAEFNNLLQTKGDIAQILNHPKTQSVIYNSEIVQELLGQDLKDLRHYLESGKSPKFDDEKILGRWDLDFYATLAQERKKRPNLTASEMSRLKKTLTEALKTVTFMATTDKKVDLKVEVSEQVRQAIQAATQAAQAAQAAAAGSPQFGGSRMSPEYAQRYGLTGPSGSRSPSPPPQAAPTTPTASTNISFSQPIYSAQGSWERQGEKYQVKLQDEKGKSQSTLATADDEKLVINAPLIALVFNRAE